MSYTARNNQTFMHTSQSENASVVLQWAEDRGWEDCEVELMEWESSMMRYAEFPCTYYGDYECELTANRPDSLCPFHAGEED